MSLDRRKFETEIDQSYLPNIVEQAKTILQKYPVYE